MIAEQYYFVAICTETKIASAEGLLLFPSRVLARSGSADPE